VNRVEIDSREGSETTILVDGNRVAASSAHLHLRAGQAPVLEVHLPATSAAHAAIERVAKVVVDEGTRTALVAMGWTPPDADPATA
jgi:hypothetical protein